MTNWTPERLSPRGPVYQAIADALAQDVRAGLLHPGERLPTHRDLARRLGVNVVTITRAYREAARRGLVEGEVGRGTFVSQIEARGPANLHLQPETGDAIDFNFNLPHPDPELVDPSELYRWLAKQGVDPLAGDYVPAGLPRHREVGAEWMARTGLETDPERVFVTSGGQHAMSVAFATLTDPGDTVLTADLTYPGMKALASVLHLRLLPIEMDDEGLLPDSFETACRKANPKALYCMPTLQNPIGVVSSVERRLELIEVARRYGVVIVEDDTTAYLIEDPPTPIANLAPEITLFLASTSKSLGSGLRIGYVHAPRPQRVAPQALRAFGERLAANIAAVSWMTPPLMAEIATHLIETGDADRIVAKRRKEALARRRLFDRALGHLATPSDQRSSFVWLALPEPWRSGDFVSELRQAGVSVTSAEAFVVGRAHAPHAVRVCIGTPRERAEVERGISILASKLARTPDVCRSLV